MVVSVVSVVVWSRCCDGRSRRDGILARDCGDVCGLVVRGDDEVVSQGKVRMVEYLCEKALNKVESEKNMWIWIHFYGIHVRPMW